MSEILKREQDLIEAMNKQNFQPFFDGDKADAYDTLADAMSKLVDYQNVVIKQTIMTPIWRMRYEGEAWRDKNESIDRERRFKHESAITACNMLNRVSGAYGCPDFAPIDTNDRYAVADFIGEFCSDLYHDGISGSGSSYEMVRQQAARHQEYDPSRIERRIADLDARFGSVIQKEREADGPDF